MAFIFDDDGGTAASSHCPVMPFAPGRMAIFYIGGRFIIEVIDLRHGTAARFASALATILPGRENFGRADSKISP